MLFKTNEKAIVTDIDGVIFDFDGGYRMVAEDILDRPITKVSNSYNLRTRYALTYEESDKVWKSMDTHQNGWSNLPLLPGADEAIFQLKEMGFSIHSVTGIDEKLKKARLENLERHGISFESLECVGFGHSSKLEPIRKIAPLMYFEDRLRLLYESDFVPHRVWVDHGDEQDGLEYHSSIIKTTKLVDWVQSFKETQKMQFQTNRSIQSVKSFKKIGL